MARAPAVAIPYRVRLDSPHPSWVAIISRSKMRRERRRRLPARLDRLMDLTIEHMKVATGDVRQLIAELDIALAGNYLPEQHHAVSLEQLFDGNVRFFVARADGVAVGCGGVGFYDGFAEVKRMYTRPTARRMGVAAGILRRLEREAREAGYSVLRLETGRYQTEALAFYLREGFERCDAFGDYASMTPRSIETSVFCQKTI
jgi:putative acetyltransferase